MGGRGRLGLQVSEEGNSMNRCWGDGEKVESRATESSGWLGPLRSFEMPLIETGDTGRVLPLHLSWVLDISLSLPNSLP